MAVEAAPSSEGMLQINLQPLDEGERERSEVPPRCATPHQREELEVDPSLSLSHSSLQRTSILQSITQ